jgi:antitoxin CptB
MDSAEADLAVRRKRVRFRAWHRGIREADLILGGYIDAHLIDLDERGLAGFEALLEIPDPELVAWVTGEEAIPPERDTPLLRQIIAFHGG